MSDAAKCENLRIRRLAAQIERLRRQLYLVQAPLPRLLLSQRLDRLLNRYYRATGLKRDGRRGK